MWDLLQAVVLGTLQGLTEFLPISSSAHLRIFPELFGWGDPGAAFTAVIQIGTELAVLIYFRHDIWRIASTWLKSLFKPEYRGHFDARMGWFIIVGSLPIVVLGVLLKDIIEQDFRNLWIIGTTLIVMGLVLGLADRIGGTDKGIKQISLRDSVLMGAAQALALIPGVSRSGATLSMGRLLGYEREAATRYAFLLAIPAVVGRRAVRAQGDPRRRQHLRLGPDDRGDGRLLRGRVRRDRVAAALHQHALLHAVRDLPGRARHRHAGAAQRRRAVGLTALSGCRLVTNDRFRGRFLAVGDQTAVRYSQPDRLNTTISTTTIVTISSSAAG